MTALLLLVVSCHFAAILVAHAHYNHNTPTFMVQQLSAKIRSHEHTNTSFIPVTPPQWTPQRGKPAWESSVLHTVPLRVAYDQHLLSRTASHP
ncbi:hypothetical protein Zmor_018414 [Zophobas morio]|uniref:Secreted protein n=1 Tax=Zophobas morio TaxID=2755281 RepID=A0AA38I755_9CUCU|nr:hypothetical protein Zmor_018414 [Zophobas morio]